jgi:hypothetical protein
MIDTAQRLEIIDKLADARDALALVEMAAESLKDSPIVMGCGFVQAFIDEAVALVEGLPAEMPS